MDKMSTIKKKYGNKKRHITKIMWVLGCVLLFSSCSEQYNISGDSSVTTLDGRMLYLKVLSDNDMMRNLDSCEVVHGKFNFMGMVDSTAMGEIYMDNEGVMPIVVENGDVSILINNTEQRVIGGSLNNRLYSFLEEKARTEDEIMNLSNEEAELILSGTDPHTAHARLLEKTNKCYSLLENLETRFIATNCNNILGTTYFMLLCSQYPYPIMTEQIQKILKKSSSSFRKLPYVQNYVHAAKANMKMMKHSKDCNITRTRSGD